MERKFFLELQTWFFMSFLLSYKNVGFLNITKKVLKFLKKYFTCQKVLKIRFVWHLSRFPTKKFNFLHLGSPPHCLMNHFQIPDARTIFLKRQDIVSKKVGFIETDFVDYFCAKWLICYGQQFSRYSQNTISDFDFFFKIRGLWNFFVLI